MRGLRKATCWEALLGSRISGVRRVSRKGPFALEVADRGLLVQIESFDRPLALWVRTLGPNGDWIHVPDDGLEKVFVDRLVVRLVVRLGRVDPYLILQFEDGVDVQIASEGLWAPIRVT